MGVKITYNLRMRTWHSHFNWSLMMKLAIALCLALLCIGGVAPRSCAPSQTILATFNAGLVPFYPGLTGEPAIDERASLLIQEVLLSKSVVLYYFALFFSSWQPVMLILCACKKSCQLTYTCKSTRTWDRRILTCSVLWIWPVRLTHKLQHVL